MLEWNGQEVEPYQTTIFPAADFFGTPTFEVHSVEARAKFS